MKHAIKTPNGLKTVMVLLGAEECSNKALQTELTASTAATTAAVASSVKAKEPSAIFASAFPATQIKLNSILRYKKDWYILSAGDTKETKHNTNRKTNIKHNLNAIIPNKYIMIINIYALDMPLKYVSGDFVI